MLYQDSKGYQRYLAIKMSTRSNTLKINEGDASKKERNKTAQQPRDNSNHCFKQGDVHENAEQF